MPRKRSRSRTSIYRAGQTTIELPACLISSTAAGLQPIQQRLRNRLGRSGVLPCDHRAPSHDAARRVRGTPPQPACPKRLRARSARSTSCLPRDSTTGRDRPDRTPRRSRRPIPRQACAWPLTRFNACRIKMSSWRTKGGPVALQILTRPSSPNHGRTLRQCCLHTGVAIGEARRS